MFKKILVALSGDGREKNVVETAVQLAEQINAELSFIRVNHEYAGEMSMMMDSPEEITKEMILEEIKGYGFGDAVDPDNIMALKAEKVDEAIAEKCSEYDLLVLGHRKVNDIKASLTDSDDEKIANETTCPVLIIDK
jgi:nucleotide-binding universal stress UspA family protein|tara:strand:+ start:4345 stop:4755 length:411 start_codon:yes stop_codon:yes gene_type:complete